MDRLHAFVAESNQIDGRGERYVGGIRVGPKSLEDPGF